MYMSVYVYSVPIHIDIIINRYIKGNGGICYMCNLTVVKNPGLMTRVTYSNKKKKTTPHLSLLQMTNIRYSLLNFFCILIIS